MTPTAPHHIPTPWADAPELVLRSLDVTAASGLSQVEATRRQQVHGPNELRRHERRGVWQILWDQFTGMIVVLLAAAAVVSFAFDEVVEGFAIVTVIFINAAIGFVTERRAVRSMEALRELGRAETTVRRDGVVHSMPAIELVPGDVVVLDAGDVLSADMRLIESAQLEVDESPLTGESLPVEKSVDAVAASAALSERPSMVFKGSAITRGSGEAVVVATGMATEVGHISSLVASAKSEATPLEKRLDRLSRHLVVLTLVVAALIAASFVASGRGVYVAVEIAIALAVATIPEGLPIVATVALARGMWRMAQRNAIVEQLSAVETLGSTTVILTDKTGTLTENRMTAVEVVLEGGSVDVLGTGLDVTCGFQVGGSDVDITSVPGLVEALRVAVLCNNAALQREGDDVTVSGDPTEVALLALGAKAQLWREGVLVDCPELRDLGFDPETKRMATLHTCAERGVVVAAVKGAPETVLEVCSTVRSASGTRPLDAAARAHWNGAVERLASRGQRVLALATAEVTSLDDFDFKDLVLLGLVGFFDPPRKSVRAAVDACQAAGIRVVMVTGDHGATAWTVAAAVGLIDPAPEAQMAFVDCRTLPEITTLSATERQSLLSAPVIARATPTQKLELINLHQDAGAVVAMTGDGVNDAPALKQADIGVAMGKRGTQVAREAADMVLSDDEFGSIVSAVAYGRAIFANIRMFVVYLLSCNVSEIITVGLGALVQGPLPILPLQILFLNLVTDVFPALALGVCEGSPALMRRPPRDPRAPLLSRQDWRTIFGLGGVIAFSVLTALFLAGTWLDKPADQATSIAFLTLAMAQLWNVFTMRNTQSGWVRNEITRNLWVWLALLLCVLLLIAAVHWQPLARVLSVADPGASGWALALGLSFLPLVVGQLMLFVRSLRERAGG